MSPDGKRCFVADGATIAALDTTTLVPDLFPSKVIQWIEVPDATPNQMLLYRGSLYIAGGTGGLFRVVLASSILSDPPAPETNTVTVLAAPFLTGGRAGDPNTYRWKRCVDVAVVEQPGRRLMFGLFAASQRHVEPTDPAELGATEVLAWRIPNSGPAIYYGRFVFDSAAVPPIGTQNDIKGTAIAADPGDSSSMYVALGIRGVWRVDISSVSGTDPRFPSASEFSFAPAVPPCGGSACPNGERFRDLAIVRRSVAGGTQALAYAALEYGRLVEFEVPPVGVTLANVLTVYTQGCNWGERVSAVVDGQNNVMVAFGSQSVSPTYADSAAPFRPTGIWSDACVTVSIEEPNPPAASPSPCQSNGIRVLRRTPTTGLTPMTISALAGVMGNSGILSQTYWGGLVLQNAGTDRYRIHESTVSGGFKIHEISHTLPAGASAPTAGPGLPEPWVHATLSRYQGPSSGFSDGTVAASDDTLVYFGGEPFGNPPPTGSLMRIEPATPTSAWDIVPVAQTFSVCAAATAPLAYEKCSTPTFSPPYPFESDLLGDPDPFRGGILGGVSWPDPWDGTVADDPLHPVRDWLLGGGPTWRQGDCTVFPGIGTCAFTNNCAPGSTPKWRKSWLPSFDYLFTLPTLDDLADQSRIGWNFVLLDPRLASGASMDMRWWQVVAPTSNSDERAETVDLLYAESDPRTEMVGGNGVFVPRVLYGARGATKFGGKAMSTRGYMEKARQLGLACVPPTLPDDVGRGQELDGVPLPGGAPLFYEMMTHVEFEDLTTSGLDHCAPLIQSGFCPGGPGPSGFRAAFNNKCNVFQLNTLSYGTRYVTAMAAGFVSSGVGIGQYSQCQWMADFGKLMVTLYDVTATPGSAAGLNPSGAPQLLRVALGPYAGHAFAVRAKNYSDGKTYVFVADLLGAIYVIDVSGDRLYPAASTPYRPVLCVPACTPILSTETVAGTQLMFPKDLIDGHRPNCVDLEIDGDVLYCALGRVGVALVDISRPSGAALNLQILAIMDTPGLAQGVAFRGTGTGRQMIVGDSRAGMRLYGRAP